MIQYEAGALAPEQVKGLTGMGHALREGQRWGNMQVVIWDFASGKVEAGSDPRGEGKGLVY